MMRAVIAHGSGKIIRAQYRETFESAIGFAETQHSIYSSVMPSLRKMERLQKLQQSHD